MSADLLPALRLLRDVAEAYETSLPTEVVEIPISIGALRALLGQVDDKARILPRARPRVVVLCGSTRFHTAFVEAARREARAGRIALTPGWFDGPQPTADEKVAADQLHERRIDLADEVLVLDVGQYVGPSTRAEIAYAASLGLPVRYLSAEGGAGDVARGARCPGARCQGRGEVYGEETLCDECGAR